MVTCAEPVSLPDFVAGLDGRIGTDQELWLDAKNKNITINMRNASECASNHAILVRWVESLPE